MKKLKNDVFISHSSSTKKIATSFETWLKHIVSSEMETFCTSTQEDLKFGNYQHARIVSNAQSSKVCLSVLDKENYKRPWILFEPGMFYGQGKEVLFVLCGELTHNHLQKIGYPVEGYGCYPRADDLEKLFVTISSLISKPAVHSKRVDIIRNRYRDNKDEILKTFHECYQSTPSDYDALMDDMGKMFSDDNS